MKKYKENNSPIIKSLMDTDFYKILMLQLIYFLYPSVSVKFSVINRKIKTGFISNIDKIELCEELDHVRSLRFTKNEINWLRENIVYNQKKVFKEEFLEWLEGFQLPEYELCCNDQYYSLEFFGPWPFASMWEIPSLAILSELKSRSLIRNFSPSLSSSIYGAAEEKLKEKLYQLNNIFDLKIADFGTRRRHSFVWQGYCIDLLRDLLGKKFLGTSNLFFSMQKNIEPIGTNGHELPMVFASLASNEEELRKAPYNVLESWAAYYGSSRLIVLADTFGTDCFLHKAPDWVKEWVGFRIDSGDPIERGESILAWWRIKDVDPKEKILIFSDSLDVALIQKIQKHFQGKVNIVFGWGTNLTNDFEGCFLGLDDKKEESLVCKVVEANQENVVKLSDDPNKMTGNETTIDYYKKVFCC